MTDDEFKAAVLARFDAMDRRFDAVDARLDAVDRRFDAMSRRLDAMIARLDEQDVVADGLSAKIDRLAVSVRASLEASEQALNAVMALGRRVTRLEHPEGGN